MWFFSPVSSSIRSSSSSARSRASSSRRALEVLGQLDREDAVVARVVELDRRVPRRTGSSCRRRAARPRARTAAARRRFPSRARSRGRPRRSPGSSRTYPSSIRLARTIVVVRYVDRLAGPVLRAGTTARRRRRPRRGARRSAVLSWTAALGALGSGRGCAAAARDPATRPRPSSGRGRGGGRSLTRSQSAWSTPPRLVDVDAEALRPVSSSASTSTPGSAASTCAGNLV